MDIKDQLRQEHSKANSLLIANYIGNDQERLKELLRIFWGNEELEAQRAGMVVSACFDQDPELLQTQIEPLIEHFLKKDLQLAVKRNSIRILQEMSIPKKYQSQLFDRCLSLISSSKETIAVQAFSMKVAYNICRSHPELVAELKAAIEYCLQISESAGVHNRGKKTLKALDRINP